MTSGNFQSFPLSSIIVARDERQRRELTGIDELAESINRTGLINPIVITRDGLLIAGERRYTAVRSLGWTHISVQFAEDLSELELQILELEENVKRVDLTWQDQCRAIDRFHALKEQTEKEWTQSKSAQALGLSDREVGRYLSVAKSLSNDRVATAEKFSVALNLVNRDNERKRTSALETISVTPSIEVKPSGEITSVESPKRKAPPLLLADFHEWAAAYTATPFNLIHCDFPYGINVADSPRQNAGIQEHYDDSRDVYFSLLNTLAMSMSNVVADSAHLIFWFSMDYYEVTKEKLSEMGWKVNPFPLIWHKSDNAGIAPDPQRTPRRTYETAFFASRGDRKLTQAGAKSNSFAHPGKKGPDGIHLSEKPVPMLQHFLSMVCDDYSTVLDPTCGSGNALKAAQALGANKVLGIEKSEDFYTTSVARYYGDENGNF